MSPFDAVDHGTAGSPSFQPALTGQRFINAFEGRVSSSSFLACSTPATGSPCGSSFPTAHPLLLAKREGGVAARVSALTGRFLELPAH